MWTSKYWYIPISLIIASGYLVGGWLWMKFGFLASGETPFQPEIAQYLSLFALGLVGGSMHCSVFYAKDANAKMYGTENLPTAIDPLGYALQILGAGFTGIMLYLAFKAGLVVVLSGDSTSDLSEEAGWLIAIFGGFGTHYVKQFANRFVAGATKNGESSASSDKKADQQPTANRSDAKSPTTDEQTADSSSKAASTGGRIGAHSLGNGEMEPKQE